MPPELFSRSRRTALRARALCAPLAADWLFRRRAEDLIERLDFVMRRFETALVCADREGIVADALRAKGMKVTTCDIVEGQADIIADEDRMLLEPAGFDLALSCCGLDSVSDLPGALILLRRAIKPGGLFLGAMSGAGTLASLRQAVAETAARPIARFHPQVELRNIGDLLARAGFVLPVADGDDVVLDFADLPALLADIRALGLSNALPALLPFHRQEVAALFARCAHGIKGEFSTLFMTGWSPEKGDPVQNGPVGVFRF